MSAPHEQEIGGPTKDLDTACANVLLAFHDWPHYNSESANEERRGALESLAEALTAARPALRALVEDGERLDWIEDRIGGTGHTLSMGGVCYWALDVQRAGPRSKTTRLGTGDDLRAALDAARSPTTDGGRRE